MTDDNAGSTGFATPSETEIVLTRVVDAPRERVFTALTGAEHLPHWFGPPGWDVPVTTTIRYGSERARDLELERVPKGWSSSFIRLDEHLRTMP